MSSRDLQAVVKTQKAFIKELLDRLEGKISEGEDNRFINVTEKGLIPIALIKELLDDPYFFGLDVKQIFELAKKSIRVTADNSDLRHNIEKLYEKAKINGDNFYANELKEILNPPEF